MNKRHLNAAQLTALKDKSSAVVRRRNSNRHNTDRKVIQCNQCQETRSYSDKRN